MADRYNPAEIEPKWQAAWQESGLYDTVEDPDRPKWYALTMLPYPVGRPAHRSLVCLHAQRRGRTLATHERLQRFLPAGL